MAGDPRKPPADDVRNPEAPEAVNREQRDDDAQAQTVAEAARHGRRLEDSKKPPGRDERDDRSEEHTSELQSLMRISYAVFCLKKKKRETKQTTKLITLTNT